MDKLNSAYSDLVERFERNGRLASAERILFWESRTMMPASGADSRAKALSALRSVANECISAPQIGELLDRAEGEELRELNPWEAANLREMRRDWRHITAVPPALLSSIVEQSGYAQAAWEAARRDDDFKSFVAPLRALLDLQCEAARIKAGVFGVNAYDALLDEQEAGISVAFIDPLFDDLAAFLPPLLAQVIDRQNGLGPGEPLPGPFPEDKQRKLSEMLAGLVGVDLTKGRLDTTTHPFATGAPGDIRITTRFNPDDVVGGIIATVHESGHAMYETGLPTEWPFQPVGRARGAATHESQSLIFEMQASRSAPFVRHLAKLLRDAFDGKGSAWSDANILRIYRRVTPSFIRVEADEVTYPLHIILRYRIERMILNGDLDIADIPEAWNALSRSLLGIVPPNDRLGCLQDIHWAMGLFGYFPTYTLGAIMAAQFFAKANEDEPDLLPALARGEFAPLLAWTCRHVHTHGSLYPSCDEMVVRATGKPLSLDAFKSHLKTRYLDE